MKAKIIVVMLFTAMSLLFLNAHLKDKQALEEANDRIAALEDRLSVAEDTLTIVFDEEWNPDLVTVDEVTVTAYNSEKRQTDSTPYQTANMEHVSPGGAALTSDLKIDYGQTVLIVGQGLVRKNDHMPGKKGLDIWTGDKKVAKYIGRTDRTIIWLQHGH